MQKCGELNQQLPVAAVADASLAPSSGLCVKAGF